NFSNPLPFSSFFRSSSRYFLSFIQDMIFGLSIWRYNDIGLRLGHCGLCRRETKIFMIHKRGSHASDRYGDINRHRIPSGSDRRGPLLRDSSHGVQGLALELRLTRSEVPFFFLSSHRPDTAEALPIQATFPRT